MSIQNNGMMQKGNYTPKLLTKILWWFSTVIPESINDCTTDRHRAKIIGSGVIFTWLYASLAWVYFWSMNIDNPLLYVPLGIFIGYGILTIDRMLIASISKNKKNFVAILFRVLLALLLGAFIAQPIILWMFEKDINSEVSILQDKKTNEKKVELENVYSLEKTDLIAKKEAILKEKAIKYEALQSAEKSFLQEIDGTGGSKKYGIAGIAAQKEKAFKRAEQAYNTFDEENKLALSNIDTRLADIDANITKDTEDFKSTKVASGFLIRIEALQSLFDKDESNALLKRYTLILIILVLFELIPIISKLYLPTGSYDDKVKIRDEVELEIAYANREKEMELKHLYNSLAQEGDEAIIRELYATMESAKKQRIDDLAQEWRMNKQMTFDDLWKRVKIEVLSVQEN